jgi:hypothetical protein
VSGHVHAQANSAPVYPLDEMVGGPQSLSGRCEEENLDPAGNRTLAVQPVTRRYTD